MAAFPRHGWEQGGKGRQQRAKLPPRIGDVLLGMTAVTKPHGMLGWETQVPARLCPISRHGPPHPPPPGPQHPPQRPAATQQRPGRGSAPALTCERADDNARQDHGQHHVRSICKERIRRLCSQTEFNPLPTPSKQKPAARQGCRGTRQEAMFLGAIPPVSFPGHREETLTHSGRGAGRRFRSG